MKTFSDTKGLRFLPSALAAARKSPYRYPGELRKALETISICGARRSQGPLGIALRKWFAKHGIDYVSDKGQQAIQKYGRTWHDDVCGRDIVMSEHIRLGGGGNRDPKDILRIHMAWCESEKVWIIGHVGRHLDVATS